MVLELIQGKKDEHTGLIGRVEEALQVNDWKYRRDPQDPIIRFGAKGKNADFKSVIFVKEEQEIVMFFVEFEGRVPEGRRKEAAEFLTRANWGLKIGNFEMDMEDGEVRYKVGIDVEGGVLSDAMVRNILMAGFSTADRYYPALMSVCFGNSIPSVAIREV